MNLVIPVALLLSASSDAPRFVGIDRARRFLFSPPVGRDHARTLVRTGAWRSLRIGRRILVDLASVEAWAEREAQGGNDE